MRINPFDYWECDPSGYLRHVFVGLLIALAFAMSKRQWLFVVTVIGVALIKELIDVSFRGRFFSVMDIICTCLPCAVILVRDRIRRVSGLIAVVLLATSCGKPDLNVYETITIKVSGQFLGHVT